MNLKSLFGFGKKTTPTELSNLENESNVEGVIGKYYENDLPVVVKFEGQLPDETTQSKLPMLTVIRWKYDGNKRNGMPPKKVNQRMIQLEAAISTSAPTLKKFKHAYSRTGNNLKELIYYSSSQEEFIQYLNVILLEHEKYPIEIDFYEDKEWEEFKKLLDDFKTNK